MYDFLISIIMVMVSTIALAQQQGPQEMPPPVPADPIEAVSTGEAYALASHINFIRQAADLPPLAIDDHLTCAGSIQAAWLDRIPPYCGHTGQAGSTTDMRVKWCGGKGLAGEIIGCGYTTYLDVVADWLKSQNHFKMIMNPKIKRMGGTAVGEQWSVVFGY
jgi:uncharacterized protein YkwD